LAEEDPMSKFTSTFNVLSHSLRLNIIKILYEKGPTSFSGLMKELNIDPGKLNFHLKSMEGIIKQDANNNYCLSDGDRGSIATKVLQSIGLVNSKAPGKEPKKRRARLRRPGLPALPERDVIESIRMARRTKKPGEVGKWIGGLLAVIGLFLYILNPQLYTVIIVGLGVISICVGAFFDYKEISVMAELARGLRKTENSSST